MTTVYVNEPRVQAAFSNSQKTTVGGIVIGNPIGLLLALTYATASGNVPISYTNQGRNPATFTNETKS